MKNTIRNTRPHDRRALILIATAMFCSILTTASAEETAALKETIQQGVTLLEAKKYEDFLRRFPVPEQLATMLKHRSLEEMARTFSKRHAQRLLEMLRQIETEKPALSEDGNLATFAVDQENFSRHKLVFAKIADRWHLRN